MEMIIGNIHRELRLICGRNTREFFKCKRYPLNGFKEERKGGKMTGLQVKERLSDCEELLPDIQYFGPGFEKSLGDQRDAFKGLPEISGAC